MKFYVASFNRWEVVEADSALDAINKTEHIFKKTGNRGEEVITVRRAKRTEIAQIEMRNTQQEEENE